MIPIAKPIIDEREKELVMEVLDSGMISIGTTVKEFEEKFALYTKSKYSIACSSGTTALHLALAASGIKKGDKVLTTPFTFIATANSILYCGAKPVFCDVEEDTFNINPSKIRETLEKEKDIKGLLIVHLYGQSSNMDEIMKIVKEYNLVLVEDCAQAHGCYYNGVHVGNFGDCGIFSFYPTKNMTTAEGGMVITNSEDVFNSSKLLREHGMSGAGVYDYIALGYNYRMTNIEAAIGLGQLEKLEGFNKKRSENAEYFNNNLKDIEWLQIPKILKNSVHCYHQYTLKVKDRDNFASYLKSKGVGSKVYYPALICDAPMYKEMGFNSSYYPIAKKLCKEVISIPVHPALSKEDREKIVEVIKSFNPAMSFTK